MGLRMDDVPHLERWLDAIALRPATKRAYEISAAINSERCSAAAAASSQLWRVRRLRPDRALVAEFLDRRPQTPKTGRLQLVRDRHECRRDDIAVSYALRLH